MKFLIAWIVFLELSLLALPYDFSGLKKAKVTSTNLNVRNMPSPKGKKVGVLTKDDIVDIQDIQSGWYEIGNNRWIFAKYTKPIIPPKSDKEQAKNKITQSKHKGRIFDSFRVDLLYGYELMTLNITNEIIDVDDNSRTALSDAGEYDFDSVDLEYKKINISLLGASLSYEIKDNKLQKSEDSSLDKQLKVKIKELIGGYGKLYKTNPWLNHTSRIQIFKRDASFSGNYVRGNSVEIFEMDKTKYSLKFTDVLEKSFFSYYQLDYENSTFPLVIYSTDTNGDDLDFIDPDFKAKKYTLVYGADFVSDSGFILGGRIGAGYSDIELSPYGLEKVEETGTTNLDTSGTINYQIGLKAGYIKDFTFEYNELSIGLLYDFEWFAEPSNERSADENDNGKAELVYQRREMMHTFKLNARLSF